MYLYLIRAVPHIRIIPLERNGDYNRNLRRRRGMDAVRESVIIDDRGAFRRLSCA